MFTPTVQPEEAHCHPLRKKQVLDLNQERLISRVYAGQPAELERAASEFRWTLLPSDSRSLYRRHNLKCGINVKYQPHINIDNWLDRSSPEFQPELAAAIFHYSARSAKDEQFEVCIATEEMKSATWKYAHGKQLLLDGTFGVCD